MKKSLKNLSKKKKYNKTCRKIGGTLSVTPMPRYWERNNLKLTNLSNNVNRRILQNTINRKGTGSLMRGTTTRFKEIMNNKIEGKSLSDIEKNLSKPHFYDISSFLCKKWDEIKDENTLKKLKYIEDEEVSNFNKKFRLNLEVYFDVYEIYSIGRCLDKNISNNKFIDKIKKINENVKYSVDDILGHILELYKKGEVEFEKSFDNFSESGLNKKLYILNKIPNLKDGDIIYAQFADAVDYPRKLFYYVNRKNKLKNNDILLSTNEWFDQIEYIEQFIESVFSNEQKLKIKNGEILEVLSEDFKSYCLPERFKNYDYYPALATIISWTFSTTCPFKYDHLINYIKEINEDAKYIKEKYYLNDPIPNIKF